MATLKTYVTDIELDHSSPVPLYHQISEPIKELILDGTIPPGAKLEDELSMAARLGVSRPTARRALQSLVDLRLVVRKRAVGTIVAPKEIHRQVKLSSLYDDLKDSGQKPTTKVISPTEKELRSGGLYDAMRSHGHEVVSASQTISARKASSEEAETLQESRGAAILSMRRISYNQSGVPIEIGDHVYRASRYRFTVSL